MRSFPVLLASLFAVLPHVAAHGYLKSVSIDGKTYQGNVPNQAAGPSCYLPVNCGGTILTVCYSR